MKQKTWKIDLASPPHDVVLTRYSPDGKAELTVIFEWKSIGTRTEVVGLSITSPSKKIAINASDLRSIPFSILESMARKQRPDLKMAGKNFEIKPGPQSGTPLTRAELQIVANLYREARELGIPTARHIAEQLSISESTVGKRIAAARKAGLLGAALGTKSGEVTKDSNGRKK
jgi:hypothetical protein